MDGLPSVDSLTARIANNPLERHKLLPTSTSTSSVLDPASKASGMIGRKDMTEKGIVAEGGDLSKVVGNTSTTGRTTTAAIAVTATPTVIVLEAEKQFVKIQPNFEIFNVSKNASSSSSSSSLSSASSLTHNMQLASQQHTAPNDIYQSYTLHTIHRPKLAEEHSIARSQKNPAVLSPTFSPSPSSSSSSFTIFDENLPTTSTYFTIKDKTQNNKNENHEITSIKQSSFTIFEEKNSTSEIKNKIVLGSFHVESQEKENERKKREKNDRDLLKEKRKKEAEIDMIREREGDRFMMKKGIENLKERQVGSKVVKEVEKENSELGEILSAMGILDSEDGTINTRLAR